MLTLAFTIVHRDNTPETISLEYISFLNTRRLRKMSQWFLRLERSGLVAVYSTKKDADSGGMESASAQATTL
jgi:hypothetical protein